ncbi:hypothetical protein [Pectinatus frisingensis]|nr:hypothetical protein [Pectinatus frisingensis]
MEVIDYLSEEQKIQQFAFACGLLNFQMASACGAREFCVPR